MIITEKYNYFHIPKTGGTKLRQLLMEFSIQHNNTLLWHGVGKNQMHIQEVPEEYAGDKRKTLISFRKLSDLILSHNAFFLRWGFEKKYDPDLWDFVKEQSISGKIYDFNPTNKKIEDRFVTVDESYERLLKIKDAFYIRQEYLLEDTYNFIYSICMKSDKLILSRGDRVNGNQFPQFMLSDTDKKQMYKHNPLWTNLEKELYES